MCGEFKAQMEPRSWGDRLANKWNFSVPSLPELIEIHVRYLGQTGEHKAMARRVVERSVTKRSEEHTSELQSQSNLVCRLLLEKKKIQLKTHTLQPVDYV